MRKYFPVILSIIVIIVAGYVVFSKKHADTMVAVQKVQENNIGAFETQRTCAKLPQFLKHLKIPQPVVIDLSQKRYKGIALHYGKKLGKTLHPRQWEQYEHFSTYTLDEQGNLYLVPMPFISIRPTTFNLQKNIYKLDTKTGKLSIFMHFEDVIPSANNPFGVNAITYDCDDHTLWVAAIDESDYQSQKGVIYHVDPGTKEIVQRIEGVDVLSMALIKSSKGKFLLVGSARDNALYAYTVKNGQAEKIPEKLLVLPSVNEHIRKIKIKGRNQFELQAIPFSYTLIAQTAKKDRIYYDVFWNEKLQKFDVSMVK